MTETDLYGPVDHPVYRTIAELADCQRHARYLFDLEVLAANFRDQPDQFNVFCCKWSVEDPEGVCGFLRRRDPEGVQQMLARVRRLGRAP